MKNLILIRHAKSDWSGWNTSLGFVSDVERPLSKRGQDACRKISQLLFTRQLKVDLVEYSNAKRATDTFNLIKGSLLFSNCKENSELYTFSSTSLMRIIANTPNEINDFLLIGHNPAIEDLVDFLVSAKHNLKDLKKLHLKYPTGAIAFIELNIFQWRDLQEKCGRLVEFVRPKDIRM